MIRIVTDTDSNLPESICKEYNIVMAPIHIIYGEEEFREYLDIDVDESYARMRSGELPTTSQPSTGEFKEIYEQILEEDPGTTILSIHVSGAMSGTCESARGAAKMLKGEDIRIFDTRTASLGQGMMVREAAIMAREGMNPYDIFDQLAVMRDNAGSFFIVKTLDNLARGGRIGKASALLGSMLEIKPLLKLTDGAVDQYSKFRTWKKALAGTVDLIIDEVKNGPDGTLHFAVAHILNEEDAQFLTDKFRIALNPDTFIITSIGPGLGVHMGEGALGVCWTVVPE